MLQILRVLIAVFAAIGITLSLPGFTWGWLAADGPKGDTKDCYFDPECHKLVDWDKIGKMKKGFFARLKFMKEKHNRDAVKPMMMRVHRVFVQAGMPDDRVDYILEKWVKYMYPEALEEAADRVDKNGCYDKGIYGVWCPKGDGWQCVKNCKKKDSALRSAFRSKIKNGPDEKGCYDKGRYGVWCPKADGWQCVKNCKEERMSNPSKAKHGHDVDWRKIKNIKRGFIARAKMVVLTNKQDEMRSNIKRMMQRVHPMLVEAGLPEDRVDNILKKWVARTTMEPKPSKIVV